MNKCIIIYIYIYQKPKDFEDNALVVLYCMFLLIFCVG